MRHALLARVAQGALFRNDVSQTIGAGKRRGVLVPWLVDAGFLPALHILLVVFRQAHPCVIQDAVGHCQAAGTPAPGVKDWGA